MFSRHEVELQVVARAKDPSDILSMKLDLSCDNGLLVDLSSQNAETGGNHAMRRRPFHLQVGSLLQSTEHAVVPTTFSVSHSTADAVSHVLHPTSLPQLTAGGRIPLYSVPSLSPYRPLPPPIPFLHPALPSPPLSLE